MSIFALGDGLRVAGADLARVGDVAGVTALEANAEKKFAGAESYLLIAQMEVAVEERAGSGGGDEREDGVVGEQRRR